MLGYNSFSRFHSFFARVSLCLVVAGALSYVYLYVSSESSEGSVRIYSKDKQDRTLIDPEKYTIFFYVDQKLQSANVSRTEYVTLNAGDVMCYDYSSISSLKFNFRHRPCVEVNNE